jgi:hypothetical protein
MKQREFREETGIDISTPEFTCIGIVGAKDSSATDIFVYETTSMPTPNPRSQWAQLENESKLGPNVYEIMSCHWHTIEELEIMKRNVETHYLLTSGIKSGRYLLQPRWSTGLILIKWGNNVRTMTSPIMVIQPIKIRRKTPIDK